MMFWWGKAMPETDEQREARVNRCLKRIASTLEQFDCEFIVRGTFAGDKIQPEIVVVPKAQK